MNPIPLAGPDVEPVTLAEMRAFLRLDDAAEDELVATLIATARRAVEAACGRVLIAQTWRVSRHAWPADNVVALPLSPLLAVEEVRLVDAAGVAAVLAPALYRLDAASDPPRVLLAVVPVPGSAPAGITINVRAGYGAAPEDVPAPVVTDTDGALGFATGSLGAFPDGRFTGGRLTWTGGANAGLAIEVKAHRVVGGTAEIDLWQRAPKPIAVGDPFTVTAGCDKRFATCRGTFANVANFRGFPHMPGNDFVIRMPRQGEPGLDGGSLFR